ncbi:hypothetical protein CVT24_013159 [Panaeolus cyanescens]|uniref:Uncharacterized protein n=1 Tax=Panaeolus cyanescens TaxID=181874 RepID=A0A409WA19_9AGAR|nr:hypothetical protein CVT24_013159 [Panaeolus cyanescens]
MSQRLMIITIVIVNILGCDHNKRPRPQDHRPNKVSHWGTIKRPLNSPILITPPSLIHLTSPHLTNASSNPNRPTIPPSSSHPPQLQLTHFTSQITHSRTGMKRPATNPQTSITRCTNTPDLSHTYHMAWISHPSHPGVAHPLPGGTTPIAQRKMPLNRCRTRVALKIPTPEPHLAHTGRAEDPYTDSPTRPILKLLATYRSTRVTHPLHAGVHRCARIKNRFVGVDMIP